MKVSMEIAGGRALSAIIMLNSYERTQVTSSLRALATQRLLDNKLKLSASDKHLINQITDGKSLLDLGHKFSERIRHQEAAIRSQNLENVQLEKRKMNHLFIEYLRTRKSIYRHSRCLPVRNRRASITNKVVQTARDKTAHCTQFLSHLRMMRFEDRERINQ